MMINMKEASHYFNFDLYEQSDQKPKKIVNVFFTTHHVNISAVTHQCDHAETRNRHRHHSHIITENMY